MWENKTIDIQSANAIFRVVAFLEEKNLFVH